MELLVSMADLFGREMKPQAIVLAVEQLEEIPVERLRVAVSQAIRESKFMPTIAELRELAGVPRAALAERAEALAAWEYLVRYANHYADWLHNPWTGEYNETSDKIPAQDRLDERTLRALHHAGGMTRLMTALKPGGRKDMAWVHKAFTEAYLLSPMVDIAHQRLETGQKVERLEAGTAAPALPSH